MKTLDLNAYGVSEMNQQELVEMNGGCGFLLAIVAGQLIGRGIVHAASNVSEVNVSLGIVSFTWDLR